MIKLVEDGLREADVLEQEEICVLYDRRGMTFDNLDPNLQAFCKPTFEKLQV
jgi:hypothetical protein